MCGRIATPVPAGGRGQARGCPAPLCMRMAVTLLYYAVISLTLIPNVFGGFHAYDRYHVWEREEGREEASANGAQRLPRPAQAEGRQPEEWGGLGSHGQGNRKGGGGWRRLGRLVCKGTPGPPPVLIPQRGWTGLGELEQRGWRHAAARRGASGTASIRGVYVRGYQWGGYIIENMPPGRQCIDPDTCCTRISSTASHFTARCATCLRFRMIYAS